VESAVNIKTKVQGHTHSRAVQLAVRQFHGGPGMKRVAPLLILTAFAINSFAADPGAEALPPHYAGDAAEVVFSAMELPKKGEFESTAAYESRLAQRTNAPREAKFIIQPEEVSYDADRQMFVVRVKEMDYYVGNTRLDKHLLEIKNTTRSGSTYVASNAFGATVTVSDSDSISYGVSWGQGNQGLDVTEHVQHFVEVPVSSLEAPALKPRLRILLVCSGLSPSIAKNTVTFRPTLNLPISGSVEHQYLDADSVAVWVFDDETGRILMKKSIPVVRPRVGIDVPVPRYTRYIQPARNELATHFSNGYFAPDQGTVVVAGTIRHDGKVIDAHVLTPAQPPSPLLDGSALAAVRKWEFVPTVIDGVAASVDFLVKVSFSVAYKDNKGHRLRVPVETADIDFNDSLTPSTSR